MDNINNEGYLTVEDICKKYSIVTKTFYNIKNSSKKSMKTKKVNRYIYYNEDDFISKAQKYGYKIQNNNDIGYENESVEEFSNLHLKKQRNIQEVYNEDERNNFHKKTDENQYNYLYVEELKKQIDELKSEKLLAKEEKNQVVDKLELTINELQNKLMEESKKSEKVFFVSDRLDKTLKTQNEFMVNLISLSSKLQNGSEVPLSDIKQLISQYSQNENLQIDRTGNDIKIINNPNVDFYKRLEQIDTSVYIEKSRREEITKLKKTNNIKTILIFLLILFLSFLIYIFLFK